jgi:CheY-like chemotaxis protein
MEDCVVPNKLRVLLVEDHEEDAKLLLRHLRRAPYEVESQRVETEEQMRGAVEAPWDLILCDYSLPRFSALAAMTVLQTSGLDLPFIIVSGVVGEEAAVAAMKAGAHDFLLKDKLDRLVPAIERELKEAEVRRQRRRAEADRARLIDELQAALAKVRTLSGLLPICAWCKKIRDDEGYWNDLATYISAHSDAKFSHGICPECRRLHFPPSGDGDASEKSATLADADRPLSSTHPSASP